VGDLRQSPLTFHLAAVDRIPTRIT